MTDGVDFFVEDRGGGCDRGAVDVGAGRHAGGTGSGIGAIWVEFIVARVCGAC
jgi:hypothetical protein